MYIPVFLALVFGPVAYASGDDPVVPILLGLVILFGGAKLGAILAQRTGQPAVLGELFAGVLIGNVALLGYDGLAFIRTTDTFEIMASIGIVLLLFEVGLESSLKDLLRVGPSSALVAIVGVIAPFAMGWYASSYLMPDHSVFVHAFIGATLCATSVGITARVLKDLGKLNTPESKIILGAAVIDDVLGLIVLAVVQGAILSAQPGSTSNSIAMGDVALISLKAFGFLAVALTLGVRFAPYVFKLGAKLKVEGMLVTLAISFCFLLSCVAAGVGLAPIIGAFAAGLIINGVKLEDYFADEEAPLEDLIMPISRFFVPIFFVMMGAKVDLSTMADGNVILIAAVLSVVALFSKQICGLVALGKGLNRLVIGIGMVPRGEVGLIFASIGSALYIGNERVIDDALYAAIVLMVMVTTMATPPALKWALARESKRGAQIKA